VTEANNPSTNSRGALLIASYRANANLRIGGYLDQNLSTQDPRGINLDDSSPMAGVFGVWSQRNDGIGYEVKVAAGFSDKDVTVTRAVINTSEAGKGSTSFRAAALSATVSYGQQLGNSRWIAAPYLGLRYNKIKRNGYSEDSEIDKPLTYADLSQETTTALAGLRFNGKFGDKINLMASAGIENDIAHNTGDYAATGVAGLTPIAFNQNIRHVRPVASVGASYAIDKRQTVVANLNYRQEAFNSSNSVSGMVTYQVGF
jgi:outer membrane autotransporter protein